MTIATLARETPANDWTVRPIAGGRLCGSTFATTLAKSIPQNDSTGPAAPESETDHEAPSPGPRYKGLTGTGEMQRSPAKAFAEHATESQNQSPHDLICKQRDDHVLAGPYGLKR